MLFLIAALVAQGPMAAPVPRPNFASLTAIDFANRCARVVSESDPEWAFCAGSIETMRQAVMQGAAGRPACDPGPAINQRTLYLYSVGAVFANARQNQNGSQQKADLAL